MDDAESTRLKRDNDRLQSENLKLKDRVAYLERGADVIERSDDYAKLFAEYEAQVARLSTALERERAARRAMPIPVSMNGHGAA